MDKCARIVGRQTTPTFQLQEECPYNTKKDCIQTLLVLKKHGVPLRTQSRRQHEMNL